MTEVRDLKFYTELVVVTVVALIASNTWVDFLQEFIREWYPHNLMALFITAAIATIAAIFLLHVLFGKNEDPLKPWSVSKHKKPSRHKEKEE